MPPLNSKRGPTCLPTEQSLITTLKPLAAQCLGRTLQDQQDRTVPGPAQKLIAHAQSQRNGARNRRGIAVERSYSQLDICPSRLQSSACKHQRPRGQPRRMHSVERNFSEHTKQLSF
jgi:hypothetical protein